MGCGIDVDLIDDPWGQWCPGIDPATDALERVSVLVRSRETSAGDYAFELGTQIRRIANQCSPGMRMGIAMILNEHGDPDAIRGWQNGEHHGRTIYALHNEQDKDD